MRAKAAAILLLLLAAGCLGQRAPDPAPPAVEAETVDVTCRLIGADGQPLAVGTCTYIFEGLPVDVSTSSEAAAVHRVERNATGTLQGHAPGLPTKAIRVLADVPKTVILALSPAEPVEPTSEFTRRWSQPTTVVRGNNEPHIVSDSKGVLYYAPISKLFRSTDGGETWKELTMPSALPTLASDTAVHVAPDDSVWFARYWGYAGGTLGCTSTDRGDSWTCDNSALPGATDRMWIAGVSRTEGYLQTNEGLYHHVWAKTATGSTKYTPHGSTTQTLAVRNGNMVYDQKNKAVWQIEYTGGTQRLYRVDGLGGVLIATDTGVPATYALPWISVHDGVLWTTGERTDGNGRHVVAARSTDQGKTWQQFRVSHAPPTASFSYIAAGPDGRVAVVYYGSDVAAPVTRNGGNWSVYVAETMDGLSARPTWVESLVVPDVHTGNLCIGLNCEQQGGDPRARYAGDLIGITMDPEGNAHLAFCVDRQGTLSQYVRQNRVGNP